MALKGTDAWYLTQSGLPTDASQLTQSGLHTDASIIEEVDENEKQMSESVANISTGWCLVGYNIS